MRLTKSVRGLVWSALAWSLTGCVGMGGGAVHDAPALKTTERVLVVDTLFVDSLGYYKGPSMCTDAAYGEIEQVRDKVKTAIAKYFPTYYSQKLKQAYVTTAVGTLKKEDCLDGLSMIPSVTGKAQSDEDARAEFAKLAHKAADDVGSKFDAYAVVKLSYQTTDNCERGNGITGRASDEKLCQEPKQGTAVPMGTVMVSLNLVDIRGTLNKVIYSDVEMIGFGRMGGAQPFGFGGGQAAEKNPFGDWKRPEHFVDLSEEQRNYLSSKIWAATDNLVARFYQKMTEAGVANRAAPDIVDVDAQLKL